MQRSSQSLVGQLLSEKQRGSRQLVCIHTYFGGFNIRFNKRWRGENRFGARQGTWDTDLLQSFSSMGLFVPPRPTYLDVS